MYRSFIFLLCVTLTSSCNDTGTIEPGNKRGENPPASSATDSREKTTHPIYRKYSPAEYRAARQKITYGNATLAEVRMALTEENVAELTNTVHALYSMRWHRGVFKLLSKMWDLDKKTYPEINWEEIAREPVRIALASTLNRIQIRDTGVFQDYIRSFREHEHEFVLAQVVVALGFNGDPADIPYLREMATGENDYVAQSAITGLGLMESPEASRALIQLAGHHRESVRKEIIDNVLRSVYNLVPASDQGDEGK